MKERQSTGSKIWKYTVLTLFAVFFLFPLFWMVLLSFKPNTEMFDTLFIFKPTLDNYKSVILSSDYLKYFRDNLIVSGGAVIISMLVSVPAAYGLARFNFKYKDDIAFEILSFKFAPEILVILPLVLIFNKLGLYDTYLGLIWVYQLIGVPLIIWVSRGYFEDISKEIEYASQVDGYSWYQTFFKILIPLVKPGLVAAGLLSFIFCWNTFMFPLLLAGFDVQTNTVMATRYISANTVRYGDMAAAATLSAVPAVVLTLFIQKHLVRGLSFGAVKG